MRASTTVTFVFSFVVSALTQGIPNDWDAVKALGHGITVRVQQLEGRQIEGRLVSVDDVAITVVAKGTTFSLDRQSIGQIDRVGRQVGKRAERGLLIGAGGGAALGYSMAETNRGLWTALMAAGWGALGALIGAADGSREHEYRLVYRAASPPASYSEPLMNAGRNHPAAKG